MNCDICKKDDGKDVTKLESVCSAKGVPYPSERELIDAGLTGAIAVNACEACRKQMENVVQRYADEKEMLLKSLMTNMLGELAALNGVKP